MLGTVYFAVCHIYITISLIHRRIFHPQWISVKILFKLEDFVGALVTGYPGISHPDDKSLVAMNVSLQYIM